MIVFVLVVIVAILLFGSSAVMGVFGMILGVIAAFIALMVALQIWQLLPSMGKGVVGAGYY